MTKNQKLTKFYYFFWLMNFDKALRIGYLAIIYFIGCVNHFVECKWIETQNQTRVLILTSLKLFHIHSVSTQLRKSVLTNCYSLFCFCSLFYSYLLSGILLPIQIQCVISPPLFVCEWITCVYCIFVWHNFSNIFISFSEHIESQFSFIHFQSQNKIVLFDYILSPDWLNLLHFVFYSNEYI